MNEQETRYQLREVIEKGWIYFAGKKVVCEDVATGVFLELNLPLLCEIYKDNEGWQDETIEDYIEIERENKK